MKSSFLMVGLVGCLLPSAPPADTGDWSDSASTADTGSVDSGTGDTGTGDTGTYDGVVYGEPGDFTAVWFLADFGIDADGTLATVHTPDGPLSPRLRAVFMTTSWWYDYADVENHCVITFDTVGAVNPAWVTDDPDAWFGFDFDPSHRTSTCGGWGDVYGAYFASWDGAWGVSVGGELVHLTTDLPGYGSAFGADEPWVFDARAQFATDPLLGNVPNPSIDFWTYGYEVDASMNASTDGNGDPIPMLDDTLALGDHTLAAGWYQVTGLWLYGLVEP